MVTLQHLLKELRKKLKPKQKSKTDLPDTEKELLTTTLIVRLPGFHLQLAQ
jgi:hypothetical protein